VVAAELRRRKSAALTVQVFRSWLEYCPDHQLPSQVAQTKVAVNCSARYYGV